MSEQKSLNLSLSPEATQNVFKKQLEDILQPLHSVNSGILNIGIQLKGRDAFKELALAWNEVEKRAKVLHYKHADNAAIQANSLDQFNDVQLPNLIRNAGGEYPYLWIKKLKEFMDTTRPNQQVAEELPTEFGNLQELVADFSSKIDQLKVDKQQIINDINGQIEGLMKAKERQDTSVNECNASINDMQRCINALIVEIEELNQSGDPNDKKLAAKKTDELTRENVKQDANEKRLSKLVAELNETKKKITEIYEKLRVVQIDQSSAETIQRTVEKVAYAITSVVQGISAFSSIYQGFDNDADFLEAYIRDTSSVPLVVEAYKDKGQVYGIIREELTDWSSKVGPF